MANFVLADGGWPDLSLSHIGLIVVALLFVASGYLLFQKTRREGVKDVVEAVLARIQEKKEEPHPTKLQQPITIQHVDQFVSVDHFNAKFTEIGHRLNSVEGKLTNQVDRDEFLSQMEETRASIDSAKETSQSSASKAHVRIDVLAAQGGEFRGKLDQIGANVNLILQNMVGKGK